MRVCPCTPACLHTIKHATLLCVRIAPMQRHHSGRPCSTLPPACIQSLPGAGHGGECEWGWGKRHRVDAGQADGANTPRRPCGPNQHAKQPPWLFRMSSTPAAAWPPLACPPAPARAGPSCCNALPCCYVVHCLSSCLQLTIFKRVCRKLGLQRWPYEKPCKADGERTPGGARAGGTPRGSGSWHLPPASQAWAGGARTGNHAAAPGGSRASSGQASGQELATAAAQVGDACCCSVGGHRASTTLVGRLFQAALLPHDCHR